MAETKYKLATAGVLTFSCTSNYLDKIAHHALQTTRWEDEMV